MRVIGSNNANVIMTLSVDDTKPPHGIVHQRLIEEIGATFGFVNRGQRPIVQVGIFSPASGTNVPIIFSNGILQIDNQNIPIQRLEISNDFSAMAVTAETTEDGEKVLNAIIDTLETSFGFRNIHKTGKRYYASNVTVQFDGDIEARLKIIAEIQKLVSPSIMKSTGITDEARLERIVFNCDPLQIPSSNAQFIGAFTLERRANHPYSENRFFSSAPMHTTEHIEVLKKIGALLENQ